MTYMLARETAPPTDVLCRSGSHKGEAAESKTVSTEGYSTSFILSTFRKVEARQVLRRGTSEVVAIPESRVAERVFGAGMSGRSKPMSGGNIQ